MRDLEYVFVCAIRGQLWGGSDQVSPYTPWVLGIKQLISFGSKYPYQLSLFAGPEKVFIKLALLTWNSK